MLAYHTAKFGYWKSLVIGDKAINTSHILLIKNGAAIIQVANAAMPWASLLTKEHPKALKSL